MQNKRLISYRRALARQEGRDPFSPDAFLPSPYQPDQRLIEQIRQEQRGKFVYENTIRQEQALAKAQPNAARGIARCTITPYSFLVPSNARVAPFLLVPQNSNRIFLQIFTAIAAGGGAGNLFYSFNSPPFGGNNLGPIAMIPIGTTGNAQGLPVERTYNSSAIPSDEIWAASSANANGTAIIVYEGVAPANVVGAP